MYHSILSLGVFELVTNILCIPWHLFAITELVTSCKSVCGNCNSLSTNTQVAHLLGVTGGLGPPVVVPVMEV